tara:strand:- start:411 stop:587 length:177 start_codon:yes stop_codon:yes gene_type:complete
MITTKRWLKELNKIKENELIKKAPHFVGFFVCGMMGRFYYGILSTNIGNGIFKSFLNI